MTRTEDPIVKEVREARKRIADFYRNDLRAIAEAASRGFPDFPSRPSESKVYNFEETLPLCACEEAVKYDASSNP